MADSKTFVTEVSLTTVRCSQIGYGFPELKINLSGLDGWTVFDHTNSHVGEFGEPCMTAGVCKRGTAGRGFSINDLIQDNPGNEVVTVQRQLIERKYESKDQDNVEVCIRSLTENLSSSVRGIKFQHSRSGAEQTFAIEACRK
ncbi:MAG: hypothetical protein ABL930_02330 [Pseudobdellovibrio sp.]